MSKALKLNFNDLSSSNYFPEIKSQKSAPNSPKNNPKSLKNSALIAKLEQNTKSDDLLITKLHETSKKLGNFTKKLSDNPISKKQYLGLLKFIKEREEYIETLEKQIQDFNEVRRVRQEETSNVVVPERIPKTSKNISELLKLRIDNEDFQETLQNLSKNLLDQKQKLTETETQKSNLLKKISILEKNLEIKNSELDTLHQKLSDLSKEASQKSDELEDLERLLKISEDKRKVAIEQVTSTEKKYFSIKSKNFHIISNQNELKVGLDEVTRSLLSKETELKDCWEQIKDLQKKLMKEKKISSCLKTDLEMTKASSKTNETCLMLKVEEILKENSELKENLSKSLQNVRKNTKRAETVVNSKFIDGYTEHHLFRLQQKYFENEEKLISTSLELEKIKRNDEYLQNQIEEKNLIIEKLNWIINETNECSGSLKAQSSSLPFDSFQEIVDIIDKVLHDNDLISSNLKCSSCSSPSQSLHIHDPCTHLECSTCFNISESICQTCIQKISHSTLVPHYGLLSHHLKSISLSLTHLRHLLTSLTF